MVTALSEVVDLIDETDEIKDSTREVLVQLGFIQPDVEDVEDDEFEEEEEGIEDITPTPPTLEELKDLITDCNSTKELKELMKSELFDGFTPSAKVKNVIDLRTAMLDFLEKEEVDEVKEVKDVEEKVTEKIAIKKKESKKDTPKKGVINTIVELIENTKKGISREDILAELIIRFPDRSPESMEKTIRVQVPSRINKERFAVKGIDGLYSKA